MRVRTYYGDGGITFDRGCEPLAIIEVPGDSRMAPSLFDDDRVLIVPVDLYRSDVFSARQLVLAATNLDPRFRVARVLIELWETTEARA